MAGARRPVLYWDTNIFLAWLKGENNPPEEVGGIREHRELFNRREVGIATSAITIAEVFQSSLSDDARRKLYEMEGRRNFRYVDAGIGVARLAHDIREYYCQLKDEVHPATVSTPDAFHLASAIATPGCSQLYTLDGKKRNKLDKDGNRTLIPLSGKIAGKYDLTVTVPSTASVSLLDLQGHE